MSDEKDKKHLNGIWWLPDAPETKYHGLLVLEDDKEAELRLLFETPQRPYKPLTQGADILHGAVENGKVFTLGNCRWAGSGNSSNGLERLKMYVGFVCDGLLMPTLEGEHISEMYCEFRSLANWTKYDGLQEKHEGTGFTLNYNDQNSELVEIQNNVSAQIRHWSGPTSHIDREKSIEVRRRVSIRLSFAKAVTIKKVFEWIRVFEDYFSVACHCYAGAQDVVLVGNFGHRQFGDKSIPADGALKFRPRFSSIESPRLGERSLLFSEADLEEGWAKSFQRWAELHAKLITPLSLYATALYARDTLDQKFVAHSQALEALHRRFYQGTYLKPADFKKNLLEKLQASVPAEVPVELREAIKSRFQYANEHSLRKRLEELSAPLESILRGKIPNWDTKTIGHLVAIRNHLTHYSVIDEAPRYSGAQLWLYCEALRLIFEASILLQMGFKRSAIDNLLLLNDHYSWSFQAVRQG